MTAALAFDLGALRCACGSAAIVSIDPGRGKEMDPVFTTIMLSRGVAARGWCRECFTGFAARLPCETPKRRRGGR